MQCALVFAQRICIGEAQPCACSYDLSALRRRAGTTCDMRFSCIATWNSQRRWVLLPAAVVAITKSQPANRSEPNMQATEHEVLCSSCLLLCSCYYHNLKQHCWRANSLGCLSERRTQTAGNSTRYS